MAATIPTAKPASNRPFLIKSSGASSSSLARLLRIARQLNAELQELRFSPPVSHVYNPLDYAWPVYEGYLRKFACGAKRVVFLGMNPGPFGMAQTGVPFGEVASVRDWLNLHGKVGRPEREHPRRLVTGFKCPRSEVSGQRLWSLFARRFGPAENFFEQHLVLNYCPLAFMEDSGRNLTPDKLSGAEKQRLFDACDRHLEQTIAILKPEWLIGVGDFARKRAEHIFGKGSPRIAQILHPSPANPSANRAWAQVVTGQLVSLGVWQ